MTDRPLCSRVTGRGAPCRQPAQPGSDPPACRYHAAAVRAVVSRVPHFYFPYLTTEEVAALESGGLTADLQPELALVRVVLRRLLGALTAGDGLPPEEQRRLSALVFSGTRTLAHLLAQQAGRGDDLQGWLDAALSAFAANHALDL